MLCFFCLDDLLPQAKWVAEEELVLIEDCIAAEEREHHFNLNATPKTSTFGVAQVYLLSFIYFTNGHRLRYQFLAADVDS